jgi:hypothetical protein
MYEQQIVHTRKTRCASLINALAYWSSAIQVRMMKQSFARFEHDSDLMSCITRELEIKKVLPN